MSRHAPSQQPLVHVPGARTGLWRVVLIAGTDRVDDGAWRHRAATLRHVGTCPACHQPLAAGPDPPDTTAIPTTYTATCTACGREFAAHGPAPKQRKSRRR